MEQWGNWSGKVTARPTVIRQLRSADDAAATAATAAAAGTTVRCVGAAHSHSPLVPTDHMIVDLSALSGVTTLDHHRLRARVRSGTTINTLGVALHAAGLSLHNQGDIDRQTIAGATATGTHGTGVALPNLSAAVTGLRLATASGDLLWTDAETEPSIWTAARQHLGAFGIVTELELQCRPAYRVREQGWTTSLDETLATLDSTVDQHRHFEFFWFPTTDRAVVKATDETDEPAEYPIAEEGARCGWSHEVLSNSRTWLHTEMEYAVPRQHGPACLAALRDLLRRDFPEMPWPIEYRTLAADDVWLSVAYGRASVTISVHVDAREDDEPLFRACEALFADFDGRPHWGKVHYRTGPELRALHPRWDDWWRCRDQVDPDRVFLNAHLQSLRDGD